MSSDPDLEEQKVGWESTNTHATVTMDLVSVTRFLGNCAVISKGKVRDSIFSGKPVVFDPGIIGMGPNKRRRLKARKKLLQSKNHTQELAVSLRRIAWLLSWQELMCECLGGRNCNTELII